MLSKIGEGLGLPRRSYFERIAGVAPGPQTLRPTRALFQPAAAKADSADAVPQRPPAQPADPILGERQPAASPFEPVDPISRPRETLAPQRALSQPADTTTGPEEMEDLPTPRPAERSRSARAVERKQASALAASQSDPKPVVSEVEVRAAPPRSASITPAESTPPEPPVAAAGPISREAFHRPSELAERPAAESDSAEERAGESVRPAPTVFALSQPRLDAATKLSPTQTVAYVPPMAVTNDSTVPPFTRVPAAEQRATAPKERVTADETFQVGKARHAASDCVAQIRVAPPATVTLPRDLDSGESAARVRIGSLEVRIVAPPPALQVAAPTTAQPIAAAPSAPLAHGFRSFGLAQG